jgi:hypothetical protein
MKQNPNQKSKGINFMPWSVVVCFQIIFLLGINLSTSFAQQITSDPNYQQQKKEVPAQADINKASVTSISNPAEKKYTVSDLPYYNYKGISDLEQAKTAWIKDYPEEYNKMKGQKVAASNITSVSSRQNIQQKSGSAIGISQSSLGTQSTKQVQVTKVTTEPKVATEPKVTVDPKVQTPKVEQVLPKDYDDGSDPSVKSK